jgi:3-hydroxyisobutyrate dehydrogenase-like beta-hydroxyacid dehydrogenase
MIVPERLGFIGLGHMGAPMCGRLLVAGLSPTVFNRTATRAEPLVARGAALASAPAEVAVQADLVITMLADGQALREVTLGPGGLLSGARPGLLLVDMSTVGPTESAEVAAACQAVGTAYLRAPVSGSTTLAEAGALVVLASGPRESFERAAPLLQHLARQLYYVGGGEEARYLKLTLNMLIGATMASLAEALTLGQKAGLDLAQMLEVFGGSAVGSPFVNYKAGPLARRDFSPTFTVRGIQKDFDLALAAARELEVATPLTALVRQQFQATSGNGWAELDLSAVLLLLERAAGLSPAD